MNRNIELFVYVWESCWVKLVGRREEIKLIKIFFHCFLGIKIREVEFNSLLFVLELFVFGKLAFDLDL